MRNYALADSHEEDSYELLDRLSRISIDENFRKTFQQMDIHDTLNNNSTNNITLDNIHTFMTSYRNRETSKSITSQLDPREEMNHVRSQIEKMCGLLDSIETSPIETIVNEMHLLNAIIYQRSKLLLPRGLLRDKSCHSSLPMHSCCPQMLSEINPDVYDFIEENESCQRYQCNYNNSYIYRVNGKTASRIQPGAPFDYRMKNKGIGSFHREKWYVIIVILYFDYCGVCSSLLLLICLQRWITVKSCFVLFTAIRSEYKVNVARTQKFMEYNDIELLCERDTLSAVGPTPGSGGYLFYCPHRNCYSSDGVFAIIKEKITSNQGNPTGDDGNVLRNKAKDVLLGNGRPELRGDNGFVHRERLAHTFTTAKTMEQTRKERKSLWDNLLGLPDSDSISAREEDVSFRKKYDSPALKSSMKSPNKSAKPKGKVFLLETINIDNPSNNEMKIEDYAQIDNYSILKSAFAFADDTVKDATNEFISPHFDIEAIYEIIKGKEKVKELAIFY